MDLAKLIGEKLREIRKAKGLRQEDMEALGINYKYYQKIEAGKINLTLKSIEKISQALKIDPRDLFFYEGELAGLLSGLSKKDIRKIKIFLKEIL